MSKILLNDTEGFDLGKLIAGKLLLQANTGGGKSWAMRRIIEQCYGKIPQIVFDTEGEFSNLREKFDFILIGKDHDIAANSKTAALLAHRLIEERVSAVIDLLEMSPYEREMFVKNFVQAMISAPHSLWLPTLLIIDEAQTYAPEGDKTECGRVLHDAAFKFRKRNFGILFATPRISALSKNVISTCKNKLIGYSSLDNDMKRAAFELGFSTKEEIISLRNLDPGQFFAFGSAISKDVIKLTVGETSTAHGSESWDITKVNIAPPTDKLKQVLAKLADLPQAAEEEAKTVAELKLKNSILERENTILKKNPPKEQITKEVIKTVEVPVLKDSQVKKLEDVLIAIVSKTEQHTNGMNALWARFNLVTEDILNCIKHPITITQPQRAIGIDLGSKGGDKSVAVMVEHQADNTTTITAVEKLTRCEAMIFSFLLKYYSLDRSFNKKQIGAATGYSLHSSGFNNALYHLNTLKLIQLDGDRISAAENRPDLAIYLDADFSIKNWLNNLGKCPKEIYEFLLNNPDRAFTKQEIAEATPSHYSVTSSGFQNALYSLNSIGLASRDADRYQLNPELLTL